MGAGQPWKAKGSGSGVGQFPKLLAASEAWPALELASPFICLMASSFLADGAGGRPEATCQKLSTARLDPGIVVAGPNSPWKNSLVCLICLFIFIF